MHKLSYKTLFIIIFFLLIAIVILLRFISPKQKIKAAWWNDSWSYRQAISITNSSGSNLTDFQVSISIGTSALVNSGKIQSDCDDIRITDINGNLLPFWIDPDMGCNTITDTIIYTKISEIPSNNGTIYIYYGNPSASNVQNGNQVFPQLFDTFEGTNLDNNKYSGGGGTITQNNFVSIVNNADGWDTYFYNNLTYTRNSSMVFQSKFKADAGTRTMIGWHDNGSGASYADLVYAIYFDNGIFRIYEDGSNSAGDVGSYTPGTWYDIKIELKTTGAKYYYKAINTNTWTLIYDSSYSSESNLRPGIAHYDVTEFSNTDNWIIRKYASTDPTSTLQSEELSPAPIAYWKFDEGIGTTTMDSTINSNIGTITGATWASEDQCIFGKCLNFNGSGSPNISIPDKNILNFGTNNFTISAWALNRDYTYPKSNFMIKKSAQCYADGGSNSGFDIGHSYQSTGVDICLRDTSNNYIRTTLVFNNGYQPSQLVNKWTHYVFIFNRSSNKVIAYINGVKQNNELDISSITGSINNTSPLTIGTMYGWQTDGLYDEIKIYPYARTTAQIKLDYNSRGSSKSSSVNLGIKSSTAPDLKSKLVAYYKFDENNGTVVNNKSGNNNTGSWNGTGSHWTTGKYGSAGNFNGSNDIVDTGSTFATLTDSFTFSAWVNPNSSQVDYADIFGNHAGGGISGIVCQQNGSTANQYYCAYGNGTSYIITPNFNLTANIWQHLVFTKNSSSIKVLINAVEINSTNSITPVYPSTYTFKIGQGYAGGGRNFNGKIDEFKIYNTALTADEIKQDYNQGSAISFGSTNQTIGGTTTSLEYCIPGDTSACSPPIAEYKFEENTGSNAKDTSGNNKTGTLNNTYSWTSGKTGSAISFNSGASANNMTTSSNVLSSSSGVLTLEASVYPTSYGSEEMTVITGNGGYYLSINTDGSINCYWYGTSPAGYHSSGAGTVPLNQWTHVTCSWDASNIRLYTNGLLKNTVAVTGTGTADTYIVIGAENTDRQFKGKIDNVKIYNYARTPAQIAYDYNKGGPVAWWKFDECQGSIANDSSGVGNTGTIVIGSSGTQNSLGTCQIGTSAAWTAGASGKINSSLNFDGTDDYVDIGSNFGTLSSYTISFWAKHNVASKMPISSKGNNNFYWYGDNSWKYVHGGTGGEFYYPKSVNIPYGTWGHFTVTYDGSNVRIYRNSKFEGSQASTGTAGFSSGFLLSQWFGGASYQFNGQIDDVRIYNYALTSEQIKTVYNGGAVNFN